jgi:hypothetical protein
MNAKDFLNNSTSDFVKGLNAAEKIIIANLMERYAAVKSMPLTPSECFSGDCIETIIQREAGKSEVKLGFEWAKPPGYNKWKEGVFDADYDGRFAE